MPAGQPRLVEIPVRPVENPDSVPVNIRVTLSGAIGGETEARAMSLYPVDQPATFVIRVPNIVGQAQISVALEPGAAPLTVAVGPLVWRYNVPN